MLARVSFRRLGKQAFRPVLSSRNRVAAPYFPALTGSSRFK